MTDTILPQNKGHLTMQRIANMLIILNKCVFADFMGFFAKMQSPVCPTNKLLPSVKLCNTLCNKYLQSFK